MSCDYRLQAGDRRVTGGYRWVTGVLQAVTDRIKTGLQNSGVKTGLQTGYREVTEMLHKGYRDYRQVTDKLQTKHKHDTGNTELNTDILCKCSHEETDAILNNLPYK